MNLQEGIPIGPKTTMRIGGTARYYAELTTKQEVEEAWQFAEEKKIPLIPLGGGSNSIFSGPVIDALVVRIKAANVARQGDLLDIEAGKILGSLVSESAEQGLDLSVLTGIPGTVGGAVFGNAGQGQKGPWIDKFIRSVTAFVDGKWKAYSNEECKFDYRESGFKDLPRAPIIWSTILEVPKGEPAAIKAEIERLIKRRIETQTHLKTAGSCFKTLPDGTMAWQLVDKAGLRGLRVGGVQMSEKHANFLINVDKGTFDDAKAIIERIRHDVPQIASVEMRFYDVHGKLVF